MRAFLRRSLLSVFLACGLSVFPLVPSASVVAVNGEGGSHGRVFLYGGATADEFGTFGGGYPTYSLTPGGTNSFSDAGNASYADNGPASNVSGSTNLAVTTSSVTGSGVISGNSTFDGTISAYYFHFGSFVDWLSVDLGGPNTAFTLSYTIQDDYSIDNGSHWLYYAAKAGTTANAGDILDVSNGSSGTTFFDNGIGSIFVTNTISGVTGSDGLVWLLFDVQAASVWNGYGFDAYAVSSTSSWSFALSLDGPVSGSVPTASPFALLLFGLTGLGIRGRRLHALAGIALLPILTAGPASASVVNVTSQADLQGRTSNGIPRGTQGLLLLGLLGVTRWARFNPPC